MSVRNGRATPTDDPAWVTTASWGLAMAARVTERLWEIGDIVNVLEAWEAAK